MDKHSEDSDGVSEGADMGETEMTTDHPQDDTEATQQQHEQPTDQQTLDQSEEEQSTEGQPHQQTAGEQTGEQTRRESETQDEPPYREISLEEAIEEQTQAQTTEQDEPLYREISMEEAMEEQTQAQATGQTSGEAEAPPYIELSLDQAQKGQISWTELMPDGEPSPLSPSTSLSSTSFLGDDHVDIQRERRMSIRRSRRRSSRMSRGGDMFAQEQEEEDEEEELRKKAWAEKKANLFSRSRLPRERAQSRDFRRLESRGVSTPSFEMPEDECPLLQLVQILGYDGGRRGNLNVLEPGVFLVLAGAYIRIIDTNQNKDQYLRATGRGSVSCAAVHLTRKYFATGESCASPDINIFRYPSLRIAAVLSRGTERHYQCLAFSPEDGNLLASQGGEPDYQLVIWDWHHETRLLRAKNVQFPVHGVAFSRYALGQLTTFGIMNITFWSIISSYTGLKLQGGTGKFGAMGVRDIESCMELPLGKALSGSDKGTLLLWEECHISAEVAGYRKTPLHKGAIMQIVREDDDVYTVGEDGKIHGLDCFEITEASAHEPGTVMSVTPDFTVDVGGKVKLMRMEHMHANPNSVPTNEKYMRYVQDARGRIWKVDLSGTLRSPPPEVVWESQSDPVFACAVSPVSHLAASAGADRTLHLHDCLQKKQVASLELKVEITALVWMPRTVDELGAGLVLGCQDGTVKKVVFRKGRGEAVEMSLSQVFKPHTQVVTSMAFSSDGLYLASASADASIFLFTMKSSDLAPSCWIKVPDRINQIVWTPPTFPYRGLLLACPRSVVIELKLPDPPDLEVAWDLELKEYEQRALVMESAKSMLRHKEERYRQLTEQLAKAKEKRQKLLAVGVLTQEEADEAAMRDAELLERAARGEEEEEEEEDDEDDEEKRKMKWLVKEKKEKFKPYFPPVRSNVLVALYDVLEPGSVWVSLGDYDTGYLYHCALPETWQPQPSESKWVEEDYLVPPDKTPNIPFEADHEVTLAFLFEDGHMLCLAYHDGAVIFVQLSRPSDLSDLAAGWRLAVHDQVEGRLSGVAMGYDASFLVTAGVDGNVFLFTYCGGLEKVDLAKAKLPADWKHHTVGCDDLPPDAPSTQQAIVLNYKRDREERASLAKERVRAVLHTLKERLKVVLAENALLPNTVRLPVHEVLINENLYEDEKERLAKVKREVTRQCAWDMERASLAINKMEDYYRHEASEIVPVTAFNSNLTVKTFPVPATMLGEFLDLGVKPRADTLLRAPGAECEAMPDDHKPRLSRSAELFEQVCGMAEEVKQDSSAARKFHANLAYVKRSRERRAARQAQWQRFLAERPGPGQEPQEDVARIQEAERTLGCLQLRNNTSHAKNLSLQWAALEGQWTLAHLERKMGDMMRAFNARLMGLRQDKLAVLDIITAMRTKLQDDDERVVRGQLGLTAAGVLEETDLPVVPALTEMEVPEARYVYDSDDLCRYRERTAGPSDTGPARRGTSRGGSIKLQEFEMRRLRASKMKKAKCRTYYRARPQSPPPAVLSLLRQEDKPQPSPNSRQKGIRGSGIRRTLQEHETLGLSDLRRQVLETHRLTMLQRATQARQAAQDMMEAFDSHLEVLHKERRRLEVDLKRGELQYVTQLERYLICQRLKDSEWALLEEKRRADSVLVEHMVSARDLGKRVETLSADLVRLREQSTQLLYHFQDTVHHIPQRRIRFLTKVFRKRIKPKQAPADSDSESDSSSESDPEDEAGQEEDEESAVFEPLDVCPPDVPENIFSYVWQLRAQRQDLDEQMAATVEEVSRCQRNLERLREQEGALRLATKDTSQALLEFRYQALTKINHLYLTVPLKLHQMALTFRSSDLDCSRSVPCVTHAILLESDVFRALLARPDQLEAEIQEEHSHFQRLKDSRRELRAACRRLEQNVIDMGQQCEREMVGKFGRLVDLAHMEWAMLNPKSQLLATMQAKRQQEDLRELGQWDADIQQAQTRMNALLRQNTVLCLQKAKLQLDLLTLEKRLDQRISKCTFGKNFPLPDPETVPDTEWLKWLVSVQREEIGSCRKEIAALGNYRTHHMPARPPRPHHRPRLGLSPLRTEPLVRLVGMSHPLHERPPLS